MVAVVRRSAYLVLLLENPPALGELVILCGASPWISEQMARNPALLDELLDRASLYTAPDKDRLHDELRQQVARLAVDDLESQLDALRYSSATAPSTQSTSVSTHAWRSVLKPSTSVASMLSIRY